MTKRRTPHSGGLGGGDELPAGLKRREERLPGIQQAREALEKEAAEAGERALAEREA